MTADTDALRLVPEMNAGAATPASDLRDYIMNPNIPKSEAEWWAGKQIAELEAKIALLAAAPAVQPAPFGWIALCVDGETHWSRDKASIWTEGGCEPEPATLEQLMLWAEHKAAVQPAAGREEIADIIRDHVSGPEYRGDEIDEAHRRDQLHAADLILAALSTPAQASESGGEATVTIPLSVARTINGAFLPLNPNKLRSAAPETIAAAHAFKAALSAPQAAPGEGEGESYGR